MDPPPRGMDERMTAADRESAPSRQQMWDERHAARDPIEVPDPDPTLVEEMSLVPPGRALDLGTGDGRNAVWLAAHGWDVTAVDFSRVGLERARALADRAGVDVEWVLADLLAWTPQPRAFDPVCLFFIHLPPPERRVVYQQRPTASHPAGRCSSSATIGRTSVWGRVARRIRPSCSPPGRWRRISRGSRSCARGP